MNAAAQRQTRTAVSLLFAVLSSASANGADPAGLDATHHHAFVLEPATLPRRTTPRQLPQAPVVTWRVRVPGGIVYPPSVAGDGAILVAQTLSTVAQYDASGRLQWTARLGPNPAASSPILLADGSRLVLTEAAEAVWFSETGRLIRQRQLPLSTFDGSPSFAALPDGSILVAEGKRLVRLDAGGDVVYWTQLEDEVRALHTEWDPWVVITARGSALTLLPDGRLRARGELGGRVDASVRLNAHRVLAILDGRRLVELELREGSTELRFSEPDLELGAAFARNGSGEMRLLATGDRALAGDAVVLAFQKDGSERFRATLPASGLPQGARGMSDLLLGGNAATLLVRSGSDAVALSADGSLVRIDGTACAEPLRPTSLADGSVVLSCRSGILARADERRAAER